MTADRPVPLAPRSPHRWARLLGDFCCCRVELAPDESGSVVLCWWDGPTVGQMRELVVEFDVLHPAALAGQLCYERRFTAHGRALSALLWLDRNPARANLHEAVVAERSADEVGYPEAGPRVWHGRAAGLLTLAGTEQHFTLPALRQVLRRARNEGWPAAARWLDGLARG